MPHWSPLLDPPPFPPEGYAPLADEIAAILGTSGDVVLIQAEAVVALEAVACSLARPGVRALNIVTSLYGRWFGGWLARAGADVVDLAAAPGQPITVAAVRDALGAGRFDMLSLVHAESAYGILNPLAAIMDLARAAGVMTVVDAVASVGGHQIDVDAMGIDVAVIGPQKALAGPAGVSAVAVSSRAWGAVAPAGDAPSILSLADQKQLWIDSGRGALPGTPPPIEFHALQAALARVKAEGMAQVQTRHLRAARAARAGVRALLGRNAVADADASNLVTAAPLPDGITAPALLASLPLGHSLDAGVGPQGERLIRLTHTGTRAELGFMLKDLGDLAAGLRRIGQTGDSDAAQDAAITAFGGSC